MLTACLFLLSTVFVLPQTTAKVDKTGVSPELRKEAVAFLRETAAETNGLQTLENRISFSAELAGLMWFEDEKEARAMFQSTINDFRQLLNRYDTLINTAEITPGDTQNPVPTEDTAQVVRKYMKAVAVRQQIATAIAEHDPNLALEFFNDTAQAVTNAKFRKQIEGQDNYFETRLLLQIAEKDVDTALKYGRKSLQKGLNYETLGLLKKIYEKDADKGISFGEDILTKLKSDGTNSENFYLFSSILEFGAKNFDEVKGKVGKKPAFSEQSLREAADLLAQYILSRDEDETGSDFASYIPQIEKFSPSRAVQIRQKFGIKPGKKNTSSQAVTAATAAVEAAKDSPEDVLKNAGNPDLRQPTKEEREKVIADARKTINEIKDPNQKLVALAGLAVQVARSGDKETAVKIMDEGRSLINIQPKNYMDFMKIWLLSSGYAQVDADKAFPLLEDTILRLNDTISAFIKVAEFIDVNGDFIEDGEFQLGSFGGDISREMLRGLGTTDTTIRSLAAADFARTRTLSNKFDRPEVRILAKMLILRGILGKPAEEGK